IIEIDEYEKTLGKISTKVLKIRELITRFEVCHFKYQQHIINIKDSIVNLKPTKEPSIIGMNHISKGKDTWKGDKTGRSFLGQQYVNVLRNWLSIHSQEKILDYYGKELSQPIKKLLGDKNSDKERLVRLLVARLTWDWKSFEEYQQEGKYKELEDQVCRMDICHYAFPEHLDFILKGIGKMEPIKNFEGCGTFTADIEKYINEQFSILCKYLKSKNRGKMNLDKNELIRIWLSACLAKTMKEQVKLKKSVPKLRNMI
ncbi:MAG: hypothetical protein P8Z35_18130, partial [Ignavibacteriaceae bacterium]